MRFVNRCHWILKLKEYLEKINNLPKHHGAEPPDTRGAMQLHRLHRVAVDCIALNYWGKHKRKMTIRGIY